MQGRPAPGGEPSTNRQLLLSSGVVGSGPVIVPIIVALPPEQAGKSGKAKQAPGEVIVVAVFRRRRRYRRIGRVLSCGGACDNCKSSQGGDVI